MQKNIFSWPEVKCKIKGNLRKEEIIEAHLTNGWRGSDLIWSAKRKLLSFRAMEVVLQYYQDPSNSKIFRFSSWHQKVRGFEK
jgi:hypothetical protein